MAQKICCGGFKLGDGLELDGKTLKVTGGSGGGSEPFVIHFEIGETISYGARDATPDKTKGEIYEAFLSGKEIIAEFERFNESYRVTCEKYFHYVDEDVPEENYVTLIFPYVDMAEMEWSCTINYDTDPTSETNVGLFREESIIKVPAFTIADDGKVLKVRKDGTKAVLEWATLE